MTKIIMSVSYDSFAWLIITLICFTANAGVFFLADTRGVEILHMFFFEQGIMGMDKVVNLFNLAVIVFSVVNSVINKNIANFGVLKNYPAMQKKTYKTKENKRDITSEPVMDYQKTADETSREWNPNIPFHGTQEEWRKHFHEIEKGEFIPWEEAKKEFDQWKKDYLSNRLK